MTVEVATYINDLQPVNPTSTDQVSQGDDHLRLIKQVLQNTLLNATRAFAIPGVFSFSTSATLTRSNGEGTNYIATTGGAVTITLPTLTAADAGWKCHFIKTTSDANPVFIKAALGSVSSGGYSVTQARRCITGARSTAVWDGSNWFITRVLALPIGSLLSYFSATLPAGYEWPNGQTLVSAATNYQEYNVANGSGVTPDVRGYAELALDNLGGAAAGHLPTTYIAATTLGAVGGVDHAALATANLPPYTPSGSVSTSTTINNGNLAVQSNPGIAAAGGINMTGTQALTLTASSSSSFSGNAQGGTSSPFSLLQPSIMLGKLLIVE